MKTPMQQHMEWLHKKYISHLQDEETGLALEVWYCLKNAEQMLEKEQQVMCEFAIDYTMQAKTAYDFHRAKFNNEL